MPQERPLRSARLPIPQCTEILRLIDHYGLTGAIMVPIMFIRMLKLSQEIRTGYDVSSMKFIIHAATSCQTDVKR